MPLPGRVRDSWGVILGPRSSLGDELFESRQVLGVDARGEIDEGGQHRFGAAVGKGLDDFLDESFHELLAPDARRVDESMADLFSAHELFAEQAFEGGLNGVEPDASACTDSAVHGLHIERAPAPQLLEDSEFELPEVGS